MAKRHPTAYRTLRIVSVLGVAAITLAGAGQPAARAEPEHMKHMKAVQELARLSERIDRIVERYNIARIDLNNAKQRVTTLRERVDEQEEKIRELRAQLAEIAAARYRSGAFNGVMAILTAKAPRKALRRATTLSTLVRDRQARVQQYEVQLSRLRRSESALESAIDARARIKRTLAQRRARIQREIIEQRKLLQRIQPPPVIRPSDTTYTGPASGSARTAIAFAYAQLGEPYAWGAAGPDSWDCSGLTMMAWRQAGVPLPHSSRMQFASGPHVPRTELQPGDLVFFGQPRVHHVGIYIGGGTMIHAVGSGSAVRIDAIDSGWYGEEYAGAVRP